MRHREGFFFSPFSFYILLALRAETLRHTEQQKKKPRWRTLHACLFSLLFLGCKERFREIVGEKRRRRRRRRRRRVKRCDLERRRHSADR